MRDHDARFREAGARVAAVGLGDSRYARHFREETGIPFPLLVDERRVAYAAARLKVGSLLHVARRFNLRARRAAKDAGFRQHRLGRNPFQLGASFVFGPGNVVFFAHVSETFGDNAAPDTLLAALPGRRPT